jgi:hypothetical protein
MLITTFELSTVQQRSDTRCMKRRDTHNNGIMEAHRQGRDSLMDWIHTRKPTCGPLNDFLFELFGKLRFVENLCRGDPEIGRLRQILNVLSGDLARRNRPQIWISSGGSCTSPSFNSSLPLLAQLLHSTVGLHAQSLSMKLLMLHLRSTGLRRLTPITLSGVIHPFFL